MEPRVFQDATNTYQSVQAGRGEAACAAKAWLVTRPSAPAPFLGQSCHCGASLKRSEVRAGAFRVPVGNAWSKCSSFSVHPSAYVRT